MGAESKPITVDLSSIETGIKALDFFAPLVWGGTFEIVGPAGCGQMVMVGELVRRLADRWNFRTVVLGVSGARSHSMLTEHLLVPDVLGIAQHVDLFLAPVDDPASALKHFKSAVAAIGEASAMRKNVLFICDYTIIREADLTRERVLKLACRRGGEIVNVGIFAPHIPSEQPPFGNNDDVDTSICFHDGLARMGYFPAVSPLASRSSLVDQGNLMPTHLRVLEDCRRVLETVKCLEAFFTQSLFATAEVTGRAGTWLSRAATVADVDVLLGGGFGIHPSRLLYTSRLTCKEERAED